MMAGISRGFNAANGIKGPKADSGITGLTCLTLNTFICQRKSQIMSKKKTTSKKCANVGGEMREKLVAKSTKIKIIQLSHGVNGLAVNRKNTCLSTQWVRVE